MTDLQITGVSSSVSDEAFAALLDGRELTEARKESLSDARALGAPIAVLVVLAEATRVRQSPKMRLPAHRFEGLSRGKGWARMGRGDSAQWGERHEDGGYEVGPGKWTVGGNDGFSRKGETKWVVKHIAVGDKTWTIAQ